eukprot:GHRR01037868.1.p1 GENE.GHRR01037868.1~~GHRR01037868.1.p1  ORF type:complete len:107 (-),score=10.94 GHRR01037868.1:103-423(-)
MQEQFEGHNPPCTLQTPYCSYMIPFIRLTATTCYSVYAIFCYRERLRANPSLVNCCTIDWFGTWPNDALEAVALKQLNEMELNASTQKMLVGLCQAMHVQVTSCLG